jgi:hypothetical protein
MTVARCTSGISACFSAAAACAGGLLPCPRISNSRLVTGAAAVQDVANTLWALARMSVAVPAPQLERLAELAHARVPHCTVQELAVSAYAFGKLRHNARALLVAIAHRAARDRAAMSDQELCLVLWALAKVECHVDSVVLEAFAAELHARMAVLPPLSMSTAVKAFAKMKYKPPVWLMNVVSAETARRLGTYKLAELSNLVWAFAQMQWQDVALFEQVEEFVIDHIHVCTRHHVSSIVTSLRQLGYQPELLVTVARSQGFAV